MRIASDNSLSIKRRTQRTMRLHISSRYKRLSYLP